MPAAYLDRGLPVVIPNAAGGRLTPSVVAFLTDGKRLVGQLARTEELEKLVKALHGEAKARTRGQERLPYVERGV